MIVRLVLLLIRSFSIDCPARDIQLISEMCEMKDGLNNLCSIQAQYLCNAIVCMILRGDTRDSLIIGLNFLIEKIVYFRVK